MILRPRKILTSAALGATAMFVLAACTPPAPAPAPVSCHGTTCVPAASSTPQPTTAPPSPSLTTSATTTTTTRATTTAHPTPSTTVTPHPPSSTASTPGFTLTATETFTGPTLSPSAWGVYHGNSNSNRWRAANCTTANGVLTLTNGVDGSTCGIASTTDQTYGKWEVHARFTAPWAPEFDSTIILWPQDDALWKNAEIDFVESNSTTRQSTDGFIHCTACTGGQLEAGDHPLDMTQWHTYTVEWTPDRIKFLIDGAPWFQTTNTKAISTAPHHLTIQSDYNPDGSTPAQSVEQVDSVQIYTYQP